MTRTKKSWFRSDYPQQT